MPIYTIETPTGRKLRIEADDESAALAGAQQWHEQQGGNAPEKSSALGDIVKSAATGFEKGATAMLGVPGDIPNALGYGASWLAAKAAEKLGLMPPGKTADDFIRDAKALDLPRNNFAPPSTADVDHVVQAVAGPYYKPQTGPGRLAERVAGFVPSAAATGGGLVGGVLAPAAGSEAAGALTQGSPAEPLARTIGALLGNVAGAAPAMVRTAPERIVRRAVSEVEPGQFDAAKALQEQAAGRGVPLSGPEAITAATNGGSKIADVQRIVEGSVAGGAKTSKFYAERPGQIAGAVGKELDTIAPQPADPYSLGPRMAETAQGAIDDVRHGINDATRPFYRAAESQALDTADFAPIQRDPAFQAGLRALRNDEVLGPVYAQQPDNSIGVVDAVTKYMRDRGEALGNRANPGFNSQTAGMFGSGAAEARDIARTPARGGSADYDLALQMQEQARRQNLEPLERGPLGRVAAASDTAQAADAILPRTPQAGGEGQLADTIARLVAADPTGAPALVRQRLANQFDDSAGRLVGGENQYGGARFAKDIAGTPQSESNLSAVLEALGPVGPAGPVQPGSRAGTMQELVDVLRATGARRPQGSPTEPNRMMTNELSLPGVLPELLSTAKTGFTTLPISFRDNMRRIQLGKGTSALADMFLAPDSVERIRALTAQRGSTPLEEAIGRSMLQPRP